ncbi:MAG: lamin tail domain-containing protein, partial [Gemmatimonadaceae bacterium]
MSRIRPVFVAGIVFFSFAAACADNIPTATLSPSHTPRMAVTGAENPVVINEVMADPSAVADDRGEWFEVHNTGASSVSLQGWTITSNNDAPHTISAGVTVAAGGFA